MPKIDWRTGLFYLLGPGDRFNLATRTPMDSKGAELWMPQLYRPLALDEEKLQSYAGLYQTAEGKIELSVDGSVLIANFQRGDRRTLVPVKKNTFYDRIDGAKVVFEINSEGTVTGLQWHRPGILKQQEKHLVKAAKQSATIEQKSSKH